MIETRLERLMLEFDARNDGFRQPGIEISLVAIILGYQTEDLLSAIDEGELRELLDYDNTCVYAKPHVLLSRRSQFSFKKYKKKAPKEEIDRRCGAALVWLRVGAGTATQLGRFYDWPSQSANAILRKLHGLGLAAKVTRSHWADPIVWRATDPSGEV